MTSILDKIDQVLSKIEEFIVGYALLLVIIVMFTNVVLRYIFRSALPWGDEFSRYLNILAVYVGVSAGVKHEAHVGVSAFVDLVLPKSWKKYVTVIAQVVVMIFCIALAYLGYVLTMAQFEMNQLSPALRMPIGFVYASVPLGMLFSVIRSIQKIKLTLTNNEIQ